MKRLGVKRPSPAMIVALIALLVALGGTAYAAHKLSGTVIKKGSEPGNRLKKNSVTGKQVNEATLNGNVMAATVPQGTVNGANTCAIKQQTGGITSAIVGLGGATPVCDVTFPRSVDNCSVGATPMHPLQDIGGQASIRYLGGPTVRVTRRNGTDNFQDAGLFTIFALCPA